MKGKTYDSGVDTSPDARTGVNSCRSQDLVHFRSCKAYKIFLAQTKRSRSTQQPQWTKHPTRYVIWSWLHCANVFYVADALFWRWYPGRREKSKEVDQGGIDTIHGSMRLWSSKHTMNHQQLLYPSWTHYVIEMYPFYHFRIHRRKTSWLGQGTFTSTPSNNLPFIPLLHYITTQHNTTQHNTTRVILILA